METELRVLVALGVTLLLVMLRLEAQRFGAAEYDEPVRGRRPSLIRRAAWYLLGVGGVALLLFVHPTPEQSLHLQVGDRAGIIVALIIGGLGIAQAVALAYLHYHRLRFPDIAAYPSGVLNEILTAFIDEAVFRGAVLGYFLWVLDATEAPAGTVYSLSILGSTVIYVLATRLGAPGRDRYMLLLATAIGLISGWATLLTGGIGAAFLGHAITRLAVFLTTGHVGLPPARGTEPEDVEKRRRMPDGWHSVDPGAARDR